MADKRVYQLDSFAGDKAELLGQYLLISDDDGSLSDKKMTVAQYLMVLGLLQGEGDIVSIAAVGGTVAFANSHGSSRNDYILVVICRSDDDDSIIGFTIDNQDENGFDITPDVDARVQWKVIDI